MAKAKVQRKMTMTRMDATRIGKNFGYMARSLKDTLPKDFVAKGLAVLENHFDNHECCGAWCSRQHESDEQKRRTKKYYRCKTKDAKLCCLLQEILLNYITFERLSDVAHGIDANCCEAFNNLHDMVCTQKQSALWLPFVVE